MATSVSLGLGKLSDNDQKQIGKWTGRSVDFKLIYKATKDGLDPATIHTKCDNQGPTVIVCWNTDGCVFGGYTSVNWFGDTTARYFYDANAFLFVLRSKTKDKLGYMPVRDASKALLYSATMGPGFGDMSFIDDDTATTADDNGVFVNNEIEQPKFGEFFHVGDHTLKEIANNNFNYTEMEVYQVVDKVLLSQPWRKDCQFGEAIVYARERLTPIAHSIPFENLLDSHDRLPFSPLFQSVIKKHICDYVPVEDTGVRQSRILLIGSVGAGKSSYVNTVNSVFRGYVTCQAAAGSAQHSLTNTYRTYQIRSDSGYLKFRLCDTRGLEDNQGLDRDDIIAMLDGHMPDLYTLRFSTSLPLNLYNPSAPIKSVTPGYIKSPSLNDKIHCVAFVIDGSSVDVISESLLSQLKSIKDLINERGISVPQVILLTKVDEISQEVEDDLSNVFYSTGIAEVVNKVAQLIGLPRSYVLPVKNYEKETELNETVDRYALLSLQQMLRFADDYLYNIMDTQANS